MNKYVNSGPKFKWEISVCMCMCVFILCVCTVYENTQIICLMLHSYALHIYKKDYVTGKLIRRQNLLIQLKD